MIFLDTCIWIELTGVKTPVEPNEVRQAQAASELFKELLQKKEIILTCTEQLIEIISTILKAKMKEYNKNTKQAGGKGVGTIKSYRKVPEFKTTKELCNQVITDLYTFSKVDRCIEPSIKDIIDNLHIVDINDYMYYEFCKEKGIGLYTFDKDYDEIDDAGIVKII